MADKEGIADIFSWMGRQIKSLFNKAEPAIVNTVKAFYNAFETIAIEAVAAEASKVISGKEKFSNAVAAVGVQVAEQGWQASQTILETLVQDSYLAWKASQKPVPGQLLVKAPE